MQQLPKVPVRNPVRHHCKITDIIYQQPINKVAPVTNIVITASITSGRKMRK